MLVLGGPYVVDGRDRLVHRRLVSFVLGPVRVVRGCLSVLAVTRHPRITVFEDLVKLFDLQRLLAKYRLGHRRLFVSVLFILDHLLVDEDADGSVDLKRTVFQKLLLGQPHQVAALVLGLNDFEAFRTLLVTDIQSSMLGLALGIVDAFLDPLLAVVVDEHAVHRLTYQSVLRILGRYVNQLGVTLKLICICIVSILKTRITRWTENATHVHHTSSGLFIEFSFI